MAKKKQRSLLQQQRAKLKAQRAAKLDRTPRLPGKGGTSAGGVKARVQRGVRRDALAKRQVETFGRALKKTLKQGSAQDKLKKAAKGTRGSGVRTAGAGGGLAKSKGSKVTKYSGKQPAGKLAKKGGLVKSPGGKAVDGSIKKVNVKVRPGDTAKKVGSGSSSRGALKGKVGGLKAAGARLAAQTAGLEIASKMAQTIGKKGQSKMSGLGIGKGPLTKKKRKMSNIPPSEGSYNNPNYGKPGDPKSATRPKKSSSGTSTPSGTKKPAVGASGGGKKSVTRDTSLDQSRKQLKYGSGSKKGVTRDTSKDTIRSKPKTSSKPQKKQMSNNERNLRRRQGRLY